MSDRRVLKRALFGVGVVALLLVGAAVGFVAAGPLRASAADGASTGGTATPSTSNTSAYCTLYLQTLEKDLGVSQSKLTSANQDAATQVIDKMYADGKITAAQKTKALNDLKNNASNPCAALAFTGHGGPGAHGGPIGGPATGLAASARTAIETAVAKALNISTTTLESDLHAGQTIAQIATAQKVTISAVNTAYLNAVQTQLNAAVKAGDITQTQANSADTSVKNAVAQGHYPLLERGGPGRGGFGGAAWGGHGGGF